MRMGGGAMKTKVRTWMAGLWVVGALASSLGCGANQEEPKGAITVAPVLAAPAAPSAPAGEGHAASSVGPAAIVIVELNPPPSLAAPAEPVTCWRGDRIFSCALADGQCCTYHSDDQSLVGCGECEGR